MRENMMAKKVTVTPENSAAIKEPLPNRVFTINDVKLTGRELGKGSYGVVFEVFMRLLSFVACMHSNVVLLSVDSVMSIQLTII